MEKVNDDNDTSSSFKLLQPDLMTVEQLCEILRACCVKNDLTSYSKNELVELFKRVALPLPQRDYTGNSWREKLLIKRQKRKSTERIDSSNAKRLCTAKESVKNSSQTSSKSTSSVSSYSNRLKPPIDSNNYTKKVLKLSLTNTGKSDLNKIIIDKKETKTSVSKNISKVNEKKIVGGKQEEKIEKSLTTSSSNNEKQNFSNGKHKRIVIDFSDSSTTTTKTPKLVNLKRSSIDEVSNSRRKLKKTITS